LGIEGKRSILVTGASSGIGAHCARALSAGGWSVFATARKPADLEKLREDGLSPLYLDYREPQSIVEAVEAMLASTGGRLDALFNNGAHAQPGAVEDVPVDALREQFEANFFGWHDLTRRIVPVMRAQGHGRIVHCSSILGLVPARWRGPYVASKHALEGLMLCLRMELEGSGIHVCLIEPGPIESRLRRKRTGLVRAQHRLRQFGPPRCLSGRNCERLRQGGIRSRYKLGPEAVYQVLRHALEDPLPRAPLRGDDPGPGRRGAEAAAARLGMFYRIWRPAPEAANRKSYRRSHVHCLQHPRHLVMVAVVIVLVRGLINMMRGGSGNTSNKLMQARVVLQFAALVLIMAALYMST
jgi:NAD(P)-dependent dehydrogenase (short-subunit alcohol dehydrogenase family)